MMSTIHDNGLKWMMMLQILLVWSLCIYNIYQWILEFTTQMRLRFPRGDWNYRVFENTC